MNKRSRNRPAGYTNKPFNELSSSQKRRRILASQKQLQQALQSTKDSEHNAVIPSDTIIESSGITNDLSMNKMEMENGIPCTSLDTKQNILEIVPCENNDCSENGNNDEERSITSSEDELILYQSSDDSDFENDFTAKLRKTFLEQNLSHTQINGLLSTLRKRESGNSYEVHSNHFTEADRGRNDSTATTFLSSLNLMTDDPEDVLIRSQQCYETLSPDVKLQLCILKEFVNLRKGMETLQERVNYLTNKLEQKDKLPIHVPETIGLPITERQSFLEFDEDNSRIEMLRNYFIEFGGGPTIQTAIREFLKETVTDSFIAENIVWTQNKGNDGKIRFKDTNISAAFYGALKNTGRFQKLTIKEYEDAAAKAIKNAHQRHYLTTYQRNHNSKENKDQ